MPARATARRHRTSRLHERRRKGSRGGGSRSGSCNLCKWHVWAGALFVAVCFLFVTQVRIDTTSVTATGVEDVSGAWQHDHHVVNKPVRDQIGTAITAQPADKVHGPAPVPVKHFGVGPGKEIVDGGPGQKMSGVKKRGKTVFGRLSAGRTKTAGIPTDEGLGQSEESSAATDGTGQSLSDSVEGRGGEGGGRGRGGGLKGSKAAGPVAGGNYRDPADGVEMEFAVGGEGAGPLETFLAAGKKLPVVLMTCNRESLLRKTIESLRNVRGMDMSTVMVLQDGSDEPVAELVRKQGLYLHQNTKTPGLRGGGRAGDGAARIAAHYKFALEHVFGKAPEAPAVIIVEDDLLFSPDFLEYLEANAPVLERDPTTLVLSAWNDNGYRERVWDKTELQRTLFFPGLGWLLTRRLYEEIKPHWPAQHWDHWLRDERQHKGRECVFPEVPRTYHIGIKGTFMDQNMHDKLFKNIDFNTDASFKWPLPTDRPATEPPPYAKAVKGNYERRVKARIAGAQHVNTLEDLAAAADRQQDVVLWYSLEQTEEQSDGWRRGSGPPFKPLSDFFGIWHEYKRASHEGMHTFRYYGHPRIMLINAAKSPYAKLKPAELISATMGTLHGSLRGAGDGGLGLDLQVVAGDRPSVSCDEVCSAKGMTCRESRFELINSCKLLVDNFLCDTCAESYGPDQPSYVELDAPKLNYPGQCLVTSKPAESRCSALHELTRRLCPCRPRSR